MQRHTLYTRTNDVLYACLMAVVLAVTIAGEVAGVLQIARAAVAVSTAARQAPAAPAGACRQRPQLARAA